MVSDSSHFLPLPSAPHPHLLTSPFLCEIFVLFYLIVVMYFTTMIIFKPIRMMPEMGELKLSLKISLFVFKNFN